MTRGIRTIHAAFAAVALAVFGVGAPALAAIDPNSGIDFVTIGAVNNPAWTGGGFNNNRGSVGYVYNIGRFEVTTAQWAEFMNAAFDRPANDRIPHVIAPYGWGAIAATPNTPGARRWSVPAGNEMIPTGGISWRTAAIYCNWLHNNKSTDRAAFMTGAYDVGTFGFSPGGETFTDQLSRSPGARYWIPSLDEWMKASHYDANKPNSDGTVGGWWLYSNSSDQPFVYGPPGVLRGGLPTTANAMWDSFDYPGLDPITVPLGAYPTVQSPWGLLDVAGGTGEWTEATFWIPDESFPRGRVLDGSIRAFVTSGAVDRPGSSSGSEFPSIPLSDFGFRIASSVPSPGAFSFTLVVLAHMRRRAR